MYKNRENMYQLKNIFLTLNDITNLETKKNKSIKNDKSRSQGKRLGKISFFFKKLKVYYCVVAENILFVPGFQTQHKVKSKVSCTKIGELSIPIYTIVEVVVNTKRFNAQFQT